ncbi:hypothetical protein [Tateyamaria sp.]|uniref:hypothetical protein n=1 Tax=Tateyamaria sp. TaxID=1929288 RepID=UPI003B20C219
MTRFDVARTQQPKSTAAYGSLRFGPLRYQLKRTIGMLPTPDNSECSRHLSELPIAHFLDRRLQAGTSTMRRTALILRVCDQKPC